MTLKDIMAHLCSSGAGWRRNTALHQQEVWLMDRLDGEVISVYSLTSTGYFRVLAKGLREALSLGQWLSVCRGLRVCRQVAFALVLCV